MLPVTSALPPLIVQSHDELHRPDQKLDRLSLNPDMPMLTPVEVEYAPAAPATNGVTRSEGGGRRVTMRGKGERRTAFQVGFSVRLASVLGAFALLFGLSGHFAVLQRARVAHDSDNVVVPLAR